MPNVYVLCIRTDLLRTKDPISRSSLSALDGLVLTKNLKSTHLERLNFRGIAMNQKYHTLFCIPSISVKYYFLYQ